MQVQESGPSCIYVALAGHKSAVGHSYMILILLKTMTIFNNTSVDFVLMSADVVLKKVIVLSEMRIA